MKMINQSTNQTSTNHHYRSHVTIISQVTSLGVLGVIIVLGNLASIFTFIKTQSMRRRSSYLIMNLCVADLFVGLVTFPMMHLFLTGIQFNTFVIILEFVDVATGMISILIMSTIAVERLYAITYPFSHRMLRYKSYVALCLLPWLISVTVCSLYLVAYLSNPPLLKLFNVYLIIHPIIVALALLIIIFSYIAIWIKSRQACSSDHDQNRVLRDRRLAVTLFFVTLASLVTWLPYQCFQNVLSHCKVCPLPHINIFFIMKFLQFGNSGLNFFIYMVRMREFRSAFLLLVKCSPSPLPSDRFGSTISRSMSVMTVRIEKQKDIKPSRSGRINMGFSHRKSYNVNERFQEGIRIGKEIEAVALSKLPSATEGGSLSWAQPRIPNQ